MKLASLKHGRDGRLVVVSRDLSRAADAFEHASNVELKPVKLTNTLAFMFETRFRQRVTKYAAELPTRQDDYIDCWKALKKHFNKKKRNLK